MRLGLYPKEIINQLKGKRHIWLHAVSVGEALAISRLIAELKRQFPKANLVISTITPTGNRIAKSIASKEDVVIYLPLDFDFIIKRVVNIINPSIFITVETELWPNLIKNLHHRKTPIVVVNGRISPGSFRGYRIIKIFMRKILEKINLFCMQTEQYAERIIYLGAPSEKVRITGNMKFDLEAASSQYSLSDLGLNDQDVLLVAGSTHNNEEEIILKTYNNLIREFKGLKLLVAPRHIERIDRVDKLIREYGFNTQKISEIKNKTLENHQNVVYLLDTLGQLQSLYSLANIVFVGGSLIKKGGHNIIEPALFGKPVIFGPYMHNFQDIVDLFINAQAAIQVNNESQLQEEIRGVLQDEKKRDLIGRRAEIIVQNNRGAVERTFNLIKDFLQSRKV